MKKLKYLILIAALLCLVCTLLACKKHPTPEPDPAPDPAPVTFTVSFDYRDGRAVQSSILTEGATIVAPEPPTRPEYNFGGWYADSALTTEAVFGTVGANVTYYAAWIPHQSSVLSFDSCGGSLVARVVVKNGTSAEPPAPPTKLGYDFVGWCEDLAAPTALYDFETAVNASKTLYAVWHISEDYVDVVAYINGEVVYEGVCEIGEKPECPVPDAAFSYLWFKNAELKVPYDFDDVATTSIELWGVCYNDGLVIENGEVLAYNGDDERVCVPAVWEGVEVTKIAAKAFAGKQMKYVTLPASIATIGSSAFANCTLLTEINIPEGCKELGAYAFSKCERLAQIGSLKGLSVIAEYTFVGCASLEAVDLPAELTEIGASAFSGCSALRSINCGDKIETIGAYAFSDCASLTEIHLSAALDSLGDGALTGCAPTLQILDGNRKYRTVAGNLYGDNGKTLLLYVPGNKEETTLHLPVGVTTIGANAFFGNTNITTLDLSGMTVLPGALAGMKALRELTIETLNAAGPYLAYYFGAPSGYANGATSVFVPKTLEKVTFTQPQTVLNNYAFYGCVGLREVNGIDSLQAIGSYAFAYTAIEVLNIPETVTEIGEGAFNRCDNLTAFTVAAENEIFSVYDGCLYNKAQTELLIVPRQKQTIVFPETITKIMQGAFYKTLVGTVVVPQSVVEIEFGAFAYADGLVDLTVPFIGGSMAENRYMLYIFGGYIIERDGENGEKEYGTNNSGAAPASLKTVRVSQSLTVVPQFAFAYLDNVSTVALKGAIEEIGLYAYYNTAIKKLTIPKTVTKIGKYAYANMYELEEVVVPGSVGANLGEGAFYAASALKSIRLEEGVTVIPFGAFYPYSSTNNQTGTRTFSSSIEEIYLPSTLVEIGERAFAYAGTNYRGPLEIRHNDFKLVMADNMQLKKIGNSAFYMSAVKEMDLPATLTEIGDFSFAYCYQLATITFGDAVNGSALEKIGAASFICCTALHKLTIYKSVTSAADVPALLLYTPSGSVLDPGDNESQNIFNVFEGTSVPTIYVRGAEIYRAAQNWDDYVDQIKEIA